MCNEPGIWLLEMQIRDKIHKERKKERMEILSADSETEKEEEERLLVINSQEKYGVGNERRLHFPNIVSRVN